MKNLKKIKLNLQKKMRKFKNKEKKIDMKKTKNSLNKEIIFNKIKIIKMMVTYFLYKIINNIFLYYINLSKKRGIYKILKII